jgi:hypothetical protein
MQSNYKMQHILLFKLMRMLLSWNELIVFNLELFPDLF